MVPDYQCHCAVWAHWVGENLLPALVSACFVPFQTQIESTSNLKVVFMFLLDLAQ